MLELGFRVDETCFTTEINVQSESRLKRKCNDWINASEKNFHVKLVSYITPV